MYSRSQYFKIQKAIKYLYKMLAHAGDRHKPELVHSLHVGFRLMDYGYGIDVVIAGFLHDILEEGRKDKNLARLFGKKVHKIVLANTKDYSIKNWEKQYPDVISRVATCGRDALVVRATDILDNLFFYMHQSKSLVGYKKLMVLVSEMNKYIDKSEQVFIDLKEIYKRYIEIK